jgi:pimeloyl-ACP methyl ester carboxylesterase
LLTNNPIEDHMSLYRQDSGTPGAPTIVFLHGAATSSWMWQAQIEALQDYHCLNIDLPGHGKSNHIPWVSMADTADQVAAIIQARATGRKAFVVGLSLGAYVTLALLTRHAASVEKAILSGVTAAPLPHARLMKMQMFFMSYLMKNPLFAYYQGRMLQIPDEAMPYYRESMRAMSRRALLTIFDELVAFRLPEALSRVMVPTLVSAGGSEVKLILDSLNMVAEAMPQAEARLAPNLHHGWNGEDPALFTAMVRAWITGAALPSALVKPSQAVPQAQRVLSI